MTNDYDPYAATMKLGEVELNAIDGPEEMVRYWKALGQINYADVPDVEKISPWDSEL